MSEKNRVAEALGNLLRYADHDVTFEEVGSGALRIGPLPAYLIPYFALSQELAGEQHDDTTIVEVFAQNAMYGYLLDEIGEVYPDVNREIYDFRIGTDFIVYAVPGESAETAANLKEH